MKEKQANFPLKSNASWVSKTSVACSRKELQTGQLVKSIAGKDKGCHYLVIGCRDNLVLLVDGRKRKAENPKQKNRLHVQPVGKVAADFAERLRAGEPISDEEIRESLLGFLEKRQFPQS